MQIIFSSNILLSLQTQAFAKQLLELNTRRPPPYHPRRSLHLWQYQCKMPLCLVRTMPHPHLAAIHPSMPWPPFSAIFSLVDWCVFRRRGSNRQRISPPIRSYSCLTAVFAAAAAAAAAAATVDDRDDRPRNIEISSSTTRNTKTGCLQLLDCANQNTNESTVRQSLSICPPA